MYSSEVITSRTMSWGQSISLPVVHDKCSIPDKSDLYFNPIHVDWYMCFLLNQKGRVCLLVNLWPMAKWLCMGEIIQTIWIHCTVIMLLGVFVLSVNYTMSFTVLSDTCFMIFHRFFHNSNGYWKYICEYTVCLYI